jgi:single-strand DNA-binding protein
MAGSINKVILIGRLGKDPEMRFTQTGRAVTSFTMATSDYWMDQNNERQERTEWHRIVAWAKLAETCAKILSKGKLVYIEGRIQTRAWDDKDGNKRYTTEIIANTMQILSSIDNSEARDMNETASAHHEPEVFEDDVPF